ncbi:type V toxin-antitoxin system endoribonuclease antitoxin GhoS [Xenorhabdus bharatensis]|uniref:type V toxin-antitoxin system endoribonuclease antitoxin GhoS n=1 Tax=Xenorhabdus bharatensis TaxID=3136256 RepID=UPI0030F3E448
MANYLIRVEIYGAGSREINALNESLKIIDFHKNVVFQNGNIMALPAGTFVGKSLNTAAEIRDKVYKLASPLSARNPSIFVCQYNEWSAYLYPASINASASES